MHFLHRDPLGSTRFLTNHLGTVRQDAIYYPFGQLWEWRVADYDIRFASLGLRRGVAAGDVEGTDDHTQFRFYGSRLYRWLSPDRIPRTPPRHCHPPARTIIPQTQSVANHVNESKRLQSKRS